MMTFADFEKRIRVLQEYEEYEDKMVSLGFNIFEQAPGTLAAEYRKLIADSFNLPSNDIYGTDLDYYIFDLNYGRDIEKFKEPIPEEFHSLKNLYDYFCTFCK